MSKRKQVKAYLTYWFLNLFLNFTIISICCVALVTTFYMGLTERQAIFIYIQQNMENS